MATKRILKLTNNEAIVKVDGSVGSVTIDLATDLKAAWETISGTPTVNILVLQASGKPESVISVARNSVNLWDLQSNAAQGINLLEIGACADNVLNTHNIVVTIGGAEGQLILKLHKIAGYQTTIRPEQTGSETPVV